MLKSESVSDATIRADDQDLFLDIYRWMLTARELDVVEEAIVKRGEAFFHVSGAGHEAVAALNPHLTDKDWLHCHYRDKALMIARGISPGMFFDSLFAKDKSHSHGRQMSAHMSDPSRNILSLVGPVGNNALQAVGVAMQVKEWKGSPIVLCAMGDGTSQQGEVLEAIAEAVRWELPVLFLIEDNHFSISTTTPEKTFFSLPGGERPDSFYNIPIRHLAGVDALSCYEGFGAAVKEIRSTRKPALIVMEVERLANHTNADDQSVYRSKEEIETARSVADPIARLRGTLEASGVPSEKIESINREIRKEIRRASDESQRGQDPEPVFDAKRPLPAHLQYRAKEYSGKSSETQLTMLEAIKEVLRHRMKENDAVTLYGEDIEDPKGDVFGLTRGLTEQFPNQVLNSPLAESTIVGVSIGRALAGGRPVAFLQFADFLPIAFNQIVSELGSMYWRSGGGWECPVIIMITCGGYRPGLGPFHAQTLESVAVHTPGLDVVMPASAGDAAGLLNAAFDSKRPTLFFYPKSCLNDRAATTSPDVRKHLVPLGKARVEGNGEDIAFVAWGNTVPLCRKAAAVLADEGVSTTLIDLRSLSPWDEQTVISIATSTRRLIVVHEDNRSCGMGAEIVATVAEKTNVLIKTVRVAREDTYVPFNFANQLEVLPSFKRILSEAAELCGFDCGWKQPIQSEPGLFTIEALGVSPTDESITVMEWLVAVGDRVDREDILAAIEADKATGELLAPVAGVVEEIVLNEGVSVQTGTPIMTVRVDDEELGRKKVLAHENPGTPILKRRSSNRSVDQEQSSLARKVDVGIVGIGTALGSLIVTNDELLASLPGKTDDDIFRSTGIRKRRRVAEGEDALSIAVAAAKAVLDSSDFDVGNVELIICSTGTPMQTTPSLASQVLFELAGEEQECQAYDITAACSGYLYGLQAAHDYLQMRPDANVLLISSEVLSPRINPEDFNTAIIFGDAATATLLRGETGAEAGFVQVHRPLLSGHGEPGTYLNLPVFRGDGTDFISMNGRKVFSQGVKRMTQMLKRACLDMSLSTEDLDLVVPHQANQRIMDAIAKQLGVSDDRVFSNIEELGNTSSSTIPLCLAELMESAESGQMWGLTAFGGGFTYGAAILEVR